MKRLIAHLILLGDFERVPPLSTEFFRHYWNCILVGLPTAFMVDFIRKWFMLNATFWMFLFIAMTANGIVGAYTHFKSGSFSARLFFWRNAEMAFICFISYIMMDIVRQIAGDNLAGEVFGKFVQISTVLYPISKIMKNIFIISRGKHPPEFVMRRLYNFEKNGDLSGLFKTDGTEEGSEKEFEDLKKKATET